MFSVYHNKNVIDNFSIHLKLYCVYINKNN